MIKSTAINHTPAPKKRAKILVLTSTFPRWANDHDPPFVFNLSKRLTEHFEVHVLAPNFPGAKPFEKMNGIYVHRFRYFWSKFEKLAGESGILPTLSKNKLYYAVLPFFVFAELLALLSLSKKIKPDIIHAHWLIPHGFLAAIAKFFFGIPFLVTAHGGDIFSLQGLSATAIKKYTIKKAHTVSAVSQAIKNLIIDISPESAPIVIPMGVDSKIFNGSQIASHIRKKNRFNGPFLLFVGRLTEKKGVEYLIKAMPKIIKHAPETKLLIVGAGENKNKLEKLSDSLKLTGSVVQFYGAVNNDKLPPIYAEADIFIGPSIKASNGDSEGFGLTFVEAGMSGCILIGSNEGGIPDIITDGVTGFLVDAKDPEKLSSQIIKAIQCRHDWPIMKKRCQTELMEKFDWQVIAQKYLSILQNILNHKQNDSYRKRSA